MDRKSMPEEEEKMSFAWRVAYAGATIAFFVGAIVQNRKHARYLRERKGRYESKKS